MAPLLVALLLQAAPAPVPVCTATVAPPVGLEAWGAAPTAAAGLLTMGKVNVLTLQPVEKVTYTPAPSRAPKPGSFGGSYQVNVTVAGTYRIALGSGAWIDVVRDGKALASTAHTEGSTCLGIRKIVDFALTPGLHTLQLSGAKSVAMRVLIVPK